MAGEVHRGLPGGVASSDEDDVPASAAAGLDGRGPVGHAETLERGEPGNGRTTVAGTGGKDDGPAGNCPPVLQLQ
jgi:hypothetical protein